MYSGSRGAILGVILAILIKHGFNFRFLFRMILFIFIGYLLSFVFNVETGVSRFVEGNLLENRISELEYAIKSFKNKFYSGYGLSQYSYIDQSLIDVDTKSSALITAHNGYLAILVQYGIIFGFFFFLNIFLEVIKVLKCYFKSFNREDHVKIYLFFIIYALLTSLFESIMGGINNILTSLFWFAFAYLSYYYTIFVKNKTK